VSTGETPLEIDNLTSRLRAIAKGRETLDVAQFQFIDLEEVRCSYGDRWPENKARILNIAEGFLRRRVDSADLLINAGGGFIVVFGSASGMAAEAAAGSLSHDLNEFFLGDVGETPSPRFGASTHAMPVKDLAESLGDVAVVPPAPREVVVGPAQIDWRYQPVWDVKREILSSWYVTPYSKATNERVPGYHFEGLAGNATQFAAIDEASLLNSEQGLQNLIANGKQALIGVSLHATSLTNLTTRARLLAMIDKLDKRYFRYRVIKIAGVAPGFPRLYINEIVSVLRAKIPNVVIGAAWDEPDLAKLLQSGPVAVGVSLPKSVVDVGAAVSTLTLMRKLSADILSAHNAHKPFFVEGMIPHDLGLKLSHAGVDNISSPRIWPAGGMPDGMLKWPLSRLAA
jgi:hypothetical protein